MIVYIARDDQWIRSAVRERLKGNAGGKRARAHNTRDVWRDIFFSRNRCFAAVALFVNFIVRAHATQLCASADSRQQPYRVRKRCDGHVSRSHGGNIDDAFTRTSRGTRRGSVDRVRRPIRGPADVRPEINNATTIHRLISIPEFDVYPIVERTCPRSSFGSVVRPRTLKPGLF